MFSAAVYAIAYAVALPPEKVQEYIDDVRYVVAQEEQGLGAAP